MIGAGLFFLAVGVPLTLLSARHIRDKREQMITVANLVGGIASIVAGVVFLALGLIDAR